MVRFSIVWRCGVGLVLGLAALVGCAVGSEPEALLEDDLTNLSGDAGGADGGAVLPPRPPPPPPPVDSGKPDDGDDAGRVPDAAAPDAGPPVVAACASATVCTGGTSLAGISGDTGSDRQSMQGSTSQWFTVRVTENDSSLFGIELSMRAELVSPPGANFDLYVYVAGGASGQECSAVAQASTSASSPESARVGWGEGLVANGLTDDRTVTLEVRHVSGTCTPGAKWSLSVIGNAP